MSGMALIEKGIADAPALVFEGQAALTHAELRDAAARTGKQLGRLLTTAVVVAAPLLDAQPGPFDHFLASGMPWVWAGGLVMLWLPTLRLPRVATALTHRVAAASLFIFLLHYSGRSLLHRIGLDIHPALDVAAGLAIGVGGWVLWERGTRWIAATLASIRPRWKTTPVNTVVTQW